MTEVKEKNQVSVVLFRVGREEFAIEIIDAKEIIKAGQIRKLPESLEYIDGIYNYRGEIIFIINLKKKLRLTEYQLYRAEENFSSEDEDGVKSQYFIIVKINNLDTGFLVDQILNVEHVSPKDIDGLNSIVQTGVDINYIKGVIKFNDRPRILLDLSKILTKTEQKSIQNEINKM